jgi:hypothetical protein
MNDKLDEKKLTAKGRKMFQKGKCPFPKRKDEKKDESAPSDEVRRFLGDCAPCAPEPTNKGVPAAQGFPLKPEDGSDPEKAIKDKQKKDAGYQAAPEPAHAGVPGAQGFPNKPEEGDEPDKAYKGESLEVRPKARWVARQLLDIA